MNPPVTFPTLFGVIDPRQAPAPRAYPADAVRRHIEATAPPVQPPYRIGVHGRAGAAAA